MALDLAINRELRMWAYSVSHSELVLMSTNDNGEYETRFFALLKPVRFISLPTTFQCRRVRSVKLDRSTKFEFVTDTAVHHVAADHFFHGEDNEPWHAPIPLGVNWSSGI